MRILVDRGRHIVDEPDDGLGHHVTGRGLAGKHHGARNAVLVGLCLDAVVARDHVENVQQLPLVFVDALHLHVEQRIHRHVDAGAPVHLFRQRDLVGPLDVAELRAEAGVVGRPAQALDLFEVVFPRRSQPLGQQPRQAHVRLLEPAAHRDAVGDVDEAIRIHAREAGEDGLLHELGVQLGHAVDLVRAHHRQVRHAHAPAVRLADDAQRGLGGAVTLEALLHFQQELLVDAIDDLEVARQEAFEELHRPGFQRLRQQRVIGVAEHLAADIPGRGPGHVVLVHEQAHELGNRQRRMRVVQLDRERAGQFFQRALFGEMGCQDVLDAGAHEEILLLEAQLLALRRGVVRIQNARQVLRFDLVLDRSRIISGIEILDVKRLQRASRPQPQMIHRGAAIARHQLIEAHREDVLRLDPARALRSTHVMRRQYAPTEAHDVARVGSGCFPYVVQAQPGAGRLALRAFGVDGLREDAVVVADAVAGRGILQRGERIQEAGGEPAETAVPEARVHFELHHRIEIVSHAGNSRPRLLDQLGIEARERLTSERPGRNSIER